jgi:hypothetical protein
MGEEEVGREADKIVSIYKSFILAFRDFWRILRLKEVSRFKALSAIRRSTPKFCGLWRERIAQF